MGCHQADVPNKPRGVPRVDDRHVLNGIFWVLRLSSNLRPSSYACALMSSTPKDYVSEKIDRPGMSGDARQGTSPGHDRLARIHFVKQPN